MDSPFASPSRLASLLALAASLCLLPAPAAGSAETGISPAGLSIAIASGSVSVTGADASGPVDVRTSANAGLSEPAAVLVLLDAWVTPAELVAFLATDKARDANSISRFGAIVLDAPLRAGSESEVQTSLAPGTYVALDAEGEHSETWSQTSFTVSQSADTAALPAPEAIEKTIDFAFRGPRTLHDGELVRFENEGDLAHMDMGLRANGRRDAEKLARSLSIGHQAAAERLVASVPIIFAGPLSGDAFQQAAITAPPGWYVQTCPLQTEDGRSEAQLGMVRVIRVLS